METASRSRIWKHFGGVFFLKDGWLRNKSPFHEPCYILIHTSINWRTLKGEGSYPYVYIQGISEFWRIAVDDGWCWREAPKRSRQKQRMTIAIAGFMFSRYILNVFYVISWSCHALSLSCECVTFDYLLFGWSCLSQRDQIFIYSLLLFPLLACSLPDKLRRLNICVVYNLGQFQKNCRRSCLVYLFVYSSICYQSVQQSVHLLVYQSVFTSRTIDRSHQARKPEPILIHPREQPLAQASKLSVLRPWRWQQKSKSDSIARFTRTKVILLRERDKDVVLWLTTGLRQRVELRLRHALVLQQSSWIKSPRAAHRHAQQQNKRGESIRWFWRGWFREPCSSQFHTCSPTLLNQHAIYALHHHHSLKLSQRWRFHLYACTTLDVVRGERLTGQMFPAYKDVISVDFPTLLTNMIDDFNGKTCDIDLDSIHHAKQND